MNYLNCLTDIFKERNFILILPALLMMINLISCNAPRNNPLDPGNPNYPFASISGKVLTFSLPYTGVPGVSVYWSNTNTIVKTDTNGNYQLNNILPVNGKLIFKKTGYISDTLNVVWKNSKKLNYDVNLNQIPYLDSISIYTVVINQFTPPGQSYQLIINCKITNKDNDIDSVYVENSQLYLKKALDFNVTGKYYEITLNDQELNVTDIEQTIGLNFNIIVKDIFNRFYNIGNDKVSRVIKNGALIQNPANDTTISSQPVLSWQRYQTGYPFKYRIEIYTNDLANSQLVFTQDNISSNAITYKVNQSLATGNYYWVIWVIDQFQNRCRSLPATFRVQ